MSLAAIAVKNKRKKSRIIAAQVAMVSTNKVDLTVVVFIPHLPQHCIIIISFIIIRLMLHSCKAQARKRQMER